jgi:hypothetical protein
MLAPVLLHSAAGPLSAAASLPTPGPHRWQLLRATGRGPPPAGGGGGSRPALWAVPPAPSGLRAAPLPTLGGVPPPAPSIPLRGLAGVMWRLVAAYGGSGQASRQPLHGGTPPQSKAKPLRGRLQRALLCSSPVPVAAQVLRGGPAPTKWGLWGRPPLRPRPAGGRSGPGPLAGRTAAQPSRGPGCGLLCSPCPCGGPQFIRRPLGPRKRGLCPLCGRLGRKDTPAAAGYLTGDLMPRPSPCGAACSGP